MTMPLTKLYGEPLGQLRRLEPSKQARMRGTLTGATGSSVDRQAYACPRLHYIWIELVVSCLSYMGPSIGVRALVKERHAVQQESYITRSGMPDASNFENQPIALRHT